MKFLYLISTAAALRDLEVTGQTNNCISVKYEGTAPFNITWVDWRVDNRDPKIDPEQTTTNDKEYDVCFSTGGAGHPWFWKIIVSDVDGSSHVKDRVDGKGIRIHDVYGDQKINGVLWWGLSTCFRQFRVTFKCPLLGEVWDQNPHQDHNQMGDHAVMHYKVWDVNQDHQTFDFVISESFQAKNYMTFTLDFDTWEQPCWDGTLNATEDISHWDEGHEHQGQVYPGYYNKFMHTFATVTENPDGAGDKIEEVVDDEVTFSRVEMIDGIGAFNNETGIPIYHEEAHGAFHYVMSTHPKFERRICAALYKFSFDAACTLASVTPGDYYIKQGGWSETSTNNYELQMDNVYQTEVWLHAVYTSESVEAGCTEDKRTPTVTISFPTWIE